MRFMNLGYLSRPDQLDAEDDAKLANRVSELLYDRVVGYVELAGCTVVEVGCGSGAGSAYLARTRHPASFLGVDLSDNMIAWCREQHELPGLQFLQGDAQNLPVASNSVDAVINVESSHCYPSRRRFFEEVMRVLRPGGSFLFADILQSSERSDVVSNLLSDAGLVVETCIDITENVIAARGVVSRSPYLRSRIREDYPSWQVPLIEEFILLDGTDTHARLVARETEYFQWKASKPLGNSTISSVAVTAETAETAGMVAD
jgi:ubiquinone/menaquinone biosynthesis C-methylase UbiE